MSDMDKKTPTQKVLDMVLIASREMSCGVLDFVLPVKGIPKIR